MVKINRVSWGKVRINEHDYHQVLIINGKVEERESDKLHRFFETTHKIGDWEKEKLLKDSPQVVLIANGWSGFLKVEDDFKKEVKKKGIKLETVLTPQVVKKYHQLIKEGRKVNALIHTTC